jgi:chromosome segregation ATPase
MNTMDDRIRTLEMRVERLETWAGPGQTEALSVNIRAIRADVVAFRGVQTKHGTQLDELTKDSARLKADVGELKGDVAVLKADVAVLKADVGELKGDVAVLQADVGELKDHVGVLKADVGALRVAVAEILRRLPEPPPADQ